MPERRLICDTGRLESAWPVHGSIMIFEDTAYFAAGRSSFLDGGIGVFATRPSHRDDEARTNGSGPL